MSGDVAPEYRAIVGLVNDHFPPATPDLPAPSPLLNIEQAIIYTRLSREDGTSHSPATQLYESRETATRQGWAIVKEFTQDADEPISGKAFADRPGWADLEAFVEQMPLSQRSKTVVMVKSFDRFSRNLEEGLATEHRFREALRVRLRASDTLFIAPETDEGWMTFVDLLKYATYERLVIVRRTKGGLRTARREGKSLGEFPRYFEKRKTGPAKQDWQIVPTQTAGEVASLRASGVGYKTIAKQVGIPYQDCFAICKFLKNESERLRKSSEAST